MGLLTIGTIGLGVLQVRGRNRVPNPPAMMTAFMRAFGLRMLDGGNLTAKIYAKIYIPASNRYI
jgi:hypothetical protein